MTVRLYGRTVGHGSLATVTAGFNAALQEAGLLEGLVELDRHRAPDTPAPGGAEARHGVLTGTLAACTAMSKNARHEQRWAMVAPNSDRIPDDLAALLWRQCTKLMVPSRWARDVLVAQYERLSGAAWQQGYREIVVVPHGVAPEYQLATALRDTAREQYAKGHFHVLHFATSERERKGTLSLLRAWERIGPRLGDAPRLHLILDAEAETALAAALVDAGRSLPSTVNMHPRADLPPRDMARALSMAHVLCQPSRGEGFGLTPLEARACGVPVVATTCTGHSEHLEEGLPGVVVIKHGPLAPIDDLPGAMAPSVSFEDIEHGLLAAYEDWKALDVMARSAAAEVAASWAWTKQLAPWLVQLTG